jgi:two-component system NarL family response regulator
MDKQKISILVVDDHPMVIGGLISCLSFYEDMEVVGQASNGKEGIQKCLELKPDVVLMDISMPTMNGIDATELMLERAADTKVLIFSMHENPEFVANIVAAGAKGFILKDTSTEEIHFAIKSVYEGRSYFSGSIASSIIENPMPKNESLTTREQTILAFIADGYSSKEIAKALDISYRTVEAHRRNIKSKLSIDSFAELIRYALDHGITKKYP